MNKREVSFSSLITLIKSRRPFSTLGIAFVFSSVFILLPIVLFMSNSFTEPYEKYNFEKIEQNGTEQNAKITDLRPVNNVTINGEHPLKISYEFSENGSTKSDKFQTMDLEKTNEMKIGSEIKIRTFENQSKIQNLEPFTFPFYLFYILPFIFFILGSIFSVIGLIPALREYSLYKNGIVKEGSIIALTPNSGLPITNIGQSILINYHYLSSSGQKFFGKSKTTDFSIMTEKKVEDKIKIFVSERDETISCVVPKVEAIKNSWSV
jgi:Na+-transporting methylmalonyl-CoA/oxaloacetate decarboxylase gamma subunit